MGCSYKERKVLQLLSKIVNSYRIPLAEYLLEHCQTQSSTVSTAVINSSRPTVAPTAPSTPEITPSSPSPDPVICVP